MESAKILDLLGNRQLFFSGLHVALALAVTVHALMNKRDVRAAIGWIGISWFSPFFGALLYFAFGINRVHRRARRLRGRHARHARHRLGAKAPSPQAERLQIAVGAITGLDVEPAAVDGILHCGDEGYPRMVAAIDGARSSVDLATFIFRVDEAGRPIVDALVRAHERGVAVRVLIDGMGGGFFRSPAYHALRRKGVPAARFLHSIWPWKMPLLDLRLHKKALIVDGETAFVGGLNIGAENLIGRPSKCPVHDIHFQLAGPVVRQIAEGFDDDWHFTTGEPLGTPHVPPATGAHRALARAIVSGPDQAVDQLVLVLLSAVASARRSIRIATPYFLPEEQLLTALQLAALRGVEVRLVMPAVNNHRLVAWASRAHISPLLEAGCRLWRSPPPFDHSKLMTVDDEWSLIGSANWDTRSLRLNFELTVEFYDPELAKKLSAIIDAKCVDPITAAEVDGRHMVMKLRDASARLMSPYI